ncbi:hypothetical protein L226DRAFT_471602, partial [Lentinus tigrinus ALCF2SS1-7]
MSRASPSTHRRQSSSSVTYPPRCQCLVDSRTRCNARTVPRRQVCDAHLAAYEKSYRDYKDAADETITLRVQLKRGDVHSLDLVEVDARIIDVRAYIDALEKELALRKEHDWTFVGEPDEGHQERLRKIEQRLAHNREIIHMLRSR